MRQEIRLIPQQVQRMMLTQQMRQSLEILQIPTIDLKQLIEQEVAMNPLLEMAERSQDTAEEILDRLVPEEREEWESRYGSAEDQGLPGDEAEDKHEFLINSLSKPPSLQDDLLEQLHLTVSPEEDRMIGEYLVGNIEPSGMLGISVEEAAQSLNVSQEAVLRILQILQTFDPPGVAARDLRECLLIQLERLGKKDAVAWHVVSDHWEDLEYNRIHRIAEALHVPEEEVLSARHIISTLDPKPGQEYGSPVPNYDIPEIKIVRMDGAWQVALCDDSLPEIQISPAYQKLMSQPGLSKEEKDYIRHNYRAAQSLMSNISQRQQTLLSVARVIVAEQQEFLNKGSAFLKPLVLRNVAERLGIHISTVSRAANKLVETPSGTLQLKDMLSQIARGVGAEPCSVEQVRSALKEIMDAEDRHNPLSDQKLAEILAQKGIKLSRRTVSKYREKLGILPAPRRRDCAMGPLEDTPPPPQSVTSSSSPDPCV